jgi:Putative auto-transporter adhesin, head GIN domain
MKKLLLLLSVVTIVFSSCRYGMGKRVHGNGNIATEQRSVTGFTGVQTHGSIDIIVSQGSFKVEVESDQNLLQYIETNVENGNLVVRYKNGIWLTDHRGAKVHVTAPVLNDFEIHGSGNITSEGKISDSNKMNLQISGSGDLRLNLDCPEIKTGTHGSGNIVLTGETRNFSSEISGSGGVRASDLKAENVKVSVHGSGDTDVTASVSLDVTISGSGDVRYKGSPKINTEVHGSGSVTKTD